MSHESDAELYHFAMTATAERWAREHPQAYRQMCDGVMKSWSGKVVGEWARLMSHLNRCCAEMAGHPSFAVWLNRRRSTETDTQEQVATQVAA